ncbi:hypothetical protein DICVIV_03300 [Dictyocaulus viviparus]|uniref:Uncharacterized protein n=1 Tax=Dictyocaulus viviparus TaxID=29172 RepID=A0A0D8Y1G6_DICVI|nr:hypothetical protein DICVIV_03300 [Dictyocaulus viviparus]
MAFFGKQELIDYIRHELRIEDDSGTCARVVAPERRRQKSGDLPLNFRMATSSDDEDNHDDSYSEYEIPIFETPSYTKQVIEARLRSRTLESGDDNESHIGNLINEKQRDSSELFVSKKVDQFEENLEKRSAVSKFLEENGALMDNPLLEYARFEAVRDKASKKILYSQLQKGNVDDYQLLMADEGGEIETDLPPLDRYRSIGDLGFTVLALVSKKAQKEELKSAHKVVVYLPNGHQYMYELENLDHTLEWLRDETVKRKKLDMVDTPSGLVKDMEYDLEDVNLFGKSLNLQQSIGNSGCLEFVLVRKFSSRGEFHPRGVMFRQKSTALLTPVSRTSINQSLPDFNIVQVGSGDASCASFERTSQIQSIEEDELNMNFLQWMDNGKQTKLFILLAIRWDLFDIVPLATIRWDLFDIVPLTSNRKSFLPNSYQKVISVFWSNLCDVRIVDRSTTGQRSVLAITWLPEARKDAVPSKHSADQISLRRIAQLYENRTWKVVMVAFETPEEALQAKEHMVDVISALNSPAYQAYQHSRNGLRSPSEAAEAILMEMADGLLPATSRHPRKPSAIKKLLGRNVLMH